MRVQQVSKYILSTICIAYVGLFFCFPTHAMSIIPGVGWVEKKALNSVVYMINQTATPLYEQATSILVSVMEVKDLKSITFVSRTITGMKYIATCLMITQVVFRVWQSKHQRAFTGQSEPYESIMFNAVIATGLIYGMPAILDIFLKMNGLLIDWIQSMGFDFSSYLKNSAFPDNSDIATALFFLIFVFGLLGLALHNAGRIAELCLLYAIGPIMAVSLAGKKEAFQIWIVQAISVVFTQALQFYCVAAGMFYAGALGAELSWTNLVLPIGTVFLSIKGPQWMKQWLYTSGAGGAAMAVSRSASQLVVYRTMMRGGK